MYLNVGKLESMIKRPIIMTTDTGNAECFSKKDGFTFGTTFDEYK